MAKLTLPDLTRAPNALAPEYTRFRVGERLLLTGHSHQAWPDRAREGQVEAWDDAALHVDEKWTRAFERAGRVRAGYARLLGDAPERIALAASTHDLLVRFLSGLPLRERPRIVTTTGEFHTIRRQLARLEEEGIEVVRVAATPVDGLAGRAAAALDDRTAAVLVSSVLFENARIVPGIADLAAAARHRGVPLLVDAYHHLNVVPFSLTALDLGDAYVVGGGYKYCQLGEGNAFLRFPEDTTLRPVVTGWFAEFGVVTGEGGERGPDAGGVPYAPGPARFAGATYDPTSHYRAARVFDYFEERELDASFLREVSLHQVDRLCRRFDELGLDPAVVARDRDAPVGGTAGFLALRAPGAGELSRRLLAAGVHTDHRGEVLRFGPAPYLSDRQLDDAMAALGEVAG